MEEKLVFKFFDDITKTESFLKLDEGELQEFIEPAIRSEYCSPNQILQSLHRWVNVTTPADTQTHEERIKTFLILVKKLPMELWDEKMFAEIFLNDLRLRDNAMCRSFRDEFLSGLFKLVERKYLKRKAETIGVMEAMGIIMGESTSSTSVSSVTFKPVAVTGPDSNKPTMEPPCRRSKQIISGGDGSDCIGYFTSKDNGSWFIGSFNLATGDVEKVTDFPRYRQYGTLLHAYTYLYFIGGTVLETASSNGQEVKGQVSDKIDVFDMAERKWMTENLPQLTRAGDDYQVCFIEEEKDGIIGCIHFLGENRIWGSDVGIFSEIILLYGMAKQKLPRQQTKQAQMTKQMFRQQQTKRKLDPFFLRGGIYRTDYGIFEAIPKLPDERTGHSTAIYESRFYVFGGVQTGSHKLASSFTYDNDANVWTKLPNMHRKRSDAAVVTHSNFIYIVGGDGDDRKKCGLTVEKFNLTTNEFELIENWLDKVPSDVIFCQMAWHMG